MSPRRPVQLAIAVTMLMAVVMAPLVSAQRGGGRGGGGGGGAPAGETRSRLDILTDFFTLDKDQKKQVKETLDAAYKGAAPIRAELKRARAALAAAIQSGKPQADIDAAAADYGAQATAMTGAEMKALAQVLTPLKADQRAKGTIPAFNLMRGMFLDDKKWDEIPEIREY